MADNEGQEKTEQATEKKLQKLREEGSVAKSTEIISFAVFTTGMVVLYLSRSFIGNNLSELTKTVLGSLDTLQININLIQLYFFKIAVFFIVTLSPVLLGVILVGVASNIGQFGFFISAKALKPKLSKFNVLSGVKKLFFSSQSYVETLKAALKLILIGTFTWFILDDLIILEES